VHAFSFARRDGSVTWARYRWEPAAGDRTLHEWDTDSSVLGDELTTRLSRWGAVRFTLVLELAGADQRTDDPSAFWPETLERFIAGELVLTEYRGSDLERHRFSPAEPPAGIDWDPDDRVLQARGRIYPMAPRH
jgi:catalase